ncbi:hypothetical protein SDC9_36485 [bioreactor metagenome]|uniref:Uncharacterized protein n=1 Tax=bioreactor metagenome TaxID=1076179 RepID=A0A644VGT7_9ZZZZ
MGASNCFSSFTTTLTFPDGTNFALAYNKATTNINVINKKTMALIAIVSPPDINKVILLFRLSS